MGLPDNVCVCMHIYVYVPNMNVCVCIYVYIYIYNIYVHMCIYRGETHNIAVLNGPGTCRCRSLSG